MVQFGIIYEVLINTKGDDLRDILITFLVVNPHLFGGKYHSDIKLFATNNQARKLL